MNIFRRLNKQFFGLERIKYLSGWLFNRIKKFTAYIAKKLTDQQITMKQNMRTMNYNEFQKN